MVCFWVWILRWFSLGTYRIRSYLFCLFQLQYFRSPKDSHPHWIGVHHCKSYVVYLQSSRDVDFSINCSKNALMNVSIQTGQSVCGECVAKKDNLSNDSVCSQAQRWRRCSQRKVVWIAPKSFLIKISSLEGNTTQQSSSTSTTSRRPFLSKCVFSVDLIIKYFTIAITSTPLYF